MCAPMLLFSNYRTMRNSKINFNLYLRSMTSSFRELGTSQSGDLQLMNLVIIWPLRREKRNESDKLDTIFRWRRVRD